VAQQYLPTALQGQVFWQPGTLGWEGQRRQQLQRRRAAQLAAAAEHDAELGEVLSSSPDDPALGSWLQRQLAGEGERLDQLRQRLWRGAPWQRHDRVLIMEARSLLWALDPLEHCPEGGVMIQAASCDDHLRLQAQLQVLDSIGRPELVIDDLAALAQRLEPGHRFEWLAARHPFRQLKPQQRLLQLLWQQRLPNQKLLFLSLTSRLLNQKTFSLVALMKRLSKLGSADATQQLRFKKKLWLQKVKFLQRRPENLLQTQKN
jgi:putative ATPase